MYYIAFSGGVDSTAVLLIFIEMGVQVEVVTMDWIPEDYPSFPYAQKIVSDACRIAEKLGVRCTVVEVRKEFEKKIIDYFVKTYLSGKTPNPCTLCNRFIKFGAFLDRINLKNGDKIATGHYAGIGEYRGSPVIRRGREPRIEQSYFLALVTPSVLERIVFPLHDKLRKDVEDYVKKKGFRIKKKSQEICFVDKKFWGLIENKIKRRKNGWILGPGGEKLRKIDDYYRYTVGQRKGLRVAYGKPLYVAEIDAATGNVFVTTKDRLGWKKMRVSACNWFVKPEEGKDYLIQIRYRAPPFKGKVIYKDNNCMIVFDEPRVIVPGQIAAVYDKDVLLGGGIIEERW